MDGLKTRLSVLASRGRGSIQLRLSLVLSLAILVMAAVAGTVAFFSARHEAHKLQDNILYQIAGVSRQQPITGVRVLHLRDRDDETQVLVWPLQPDQPSLHVPKDGDDALTLPNDLKTGRHTLALGHETYRIVVPSAVDGQRIAVAQETHFRDKSATNSAFRTVMPFLAFVPILVIIVILLVRGMFRPIAALSASIDRRDDQDLRPVGDHQLPTEVRPFARAIDRLLERVGQSMEAQRRFVADAAHELRSPMTALSLQAERFTQTDMTPEAHARLAELRAGIERVRKLLNQLLALARAQSPAAHAPTLVSVQQTFRRALEDLMPLSEARHIDIGMEEIQDARIRVNELELITLVKNLLDNAIRYTPEGGHVNLAVTQDAESVTLHVSDTGPGIAPAERERVFDPFYRILGSGQTGSGLGLVIVRTIVHRLGADITLDFTDPDHQRGLHVSVRFPVQAAGN
jgi:two-component system OmpR family sensor kinase